MTVEESPSALDDGTTSFEGSSEPFDSARRAVVPFVSMLAAVAIAAWLPFRAFRDFYLSGDHIAQWLPVSRRLGELVASGESHLMDPTMWRSRTA